MTKPKREIPHEELDKKKDGDNKSGRYMPLGTQLAKQMLKSPDSKEIINVPIRLIDKIIFPSNECPHCGSQATYHKVIQESGDVGGNVLRDEEIPFKDRLSGGQGGYAYIKYDSCLDCYREFILQIYVWRFEKNHPET